MKKFHLFLLSAMVFATAKAQLNGDGYYRVQNNKSERMILVTDNKGKVDMAASSVDLRSLQTRKSFSNVVSDPASVIYIQHLSGGYVLKAQGTDTYTMSSAYLQINKVGNLYTAGASKAGMTKYLFDNDIMDDIMGYVVQTDSGNVSDSDADQTRKFWRINPVTQADGQYFGLAPTVQVGSQYYQTFYAAFPFSFASSGMKAYYVKQIDASMGIAILTEIQGTVPASTPVIVSCSSAAPANNKLNVGATGGTAVSSNLLTGVYFNRYDERRNVVNRTAYNPQTMRLIGKTSDGSIGFITSSSKYVPRNTAYLNVPAGTPAQLKLMTEAEYEAEKQKDAVTITAKSVSRTYGDANPTLEYTVTGTGTLRGTPQLSCQATASSPVGTYPIVVSKGSVSNYVVNTVNGTLTVTKAPLTISAGSYTIKQNQALPTFTATYSGFKLGETESVLTTKPTLTTNAPADKAPGTYKVTVSGAVAGNYDISYVEGTLTILPADPITITANSVQKVYGAAMPQFTYTVSGGTVTGTPQLTCQATATSDAGTYAITVSKGTIDYPNLKFVDGTLTVTKAPLTITANSYTMQETDAVPAFGYQCAGFTAGDDDNALTTKPTITATGLTADKTPGRYELVVAGAEAKNYAISYVNGQLTITQAPTITVRATDAQKVYGDAMPTLTYTVEGGTLTGAPVLECAATEASPAGTYAIVVKQGTIAYPRLQFVDATLTVQQAPLTITAGSYTMKQTDEWPEFAASYDGFKLNDTPEQLTTQPVLTTNAPADKTPGEYDVTAAGAASPNYAISYVPGKLIITEADQIVVMAVDANMTYGDAVPQLTYVVEGGQLEGEPAISCDATSLSPVGTYAITVAQGTLTYPNLRFVDATLSVTQAPLTVSVGTYEREEGQENPEFVLTYEGFRNDDDASVLTTLPQATTEATVDSAPGEYVITVQGGEAQNYALNYVNGLLVVTEINGIATMTYATPVDVYTLTGRKVRSHVTSLAGLPQGVYLVNGHKVVVSRR